MLFGTYSRTYFAVVEVLAQPFTSSAYTAVWTMVYLLLAIIIPKLADITIVTCCRCLADIAMMRSLLRCSACHAQHILCAFSVEIVIFNRIVAMSAGIPTSG